MLYIIINIEHLIEARAYKFPNLAVAPPGFPSLSQVPQKDQSAGRISVTYKPYYCKSTNVN